MRLAVGILGVVIDFLDPVFHAAEGSSAHGLLRNAVDSHQRRPAALGPTRSSARPEVFRTSRQQRPQMTADKRTQFESTVFCGFGPRRRIHLKITTLASAYFLVQNSDANEKCRSATRIAKNRGGPPHGREHQQGAG
jgi:hypothetical protein